MLYPIDFNFCVNLFWSSLINTVCFLAKLANRSRIVSSSFCLAFFLLSISRWHLLETSHETWLHLPASESHLELSQSQLRTVCSKDVMVGFDGTRPTENMKRLRIISCLHSFPFLLAFKLKHCLSSAMEGL